MRPAVFLDRDGTINEQMGYINHLDRFILLPGVVEAIKLLNENGILTIVISNQSGVARGYFPIELVYGIHARMDALLSNKGARIDGIFFCPHHPQGVVPEYTTTCQCRKPGTGLIAMARDRFDIDMAESYFIGDTCLDLETARRASLEGVLVLTGYGRGEREYVLPGRDVRPAYIAEDILEAVCWILGSGGDKMIVPSSPVETPHLSAGRRQGNSLEETQ